MSGGEKPPAAMRQTDFVSQDYSQWFNLLKDIVMKALPIAKWGLRIGSLAGGPVGIIVGLIAAELLEMAFDAATDFAVEALADATALPGAPDIKEGSPNVFFNLLPAARGGKQGDDTVLGEIAQGSEWVNINTRPSARQGDRVKGGGKVVYKEPYDPNIYVGGPPTPYANRLELPGELQAILEFGEQLKALRDLPKNLRNLRTDALKTYNSYQRGNNTIAAIRAMKTYKGADKIWGSLSQ